MAFRVFAHVLVLFLAIHADAQSSRFTYQGRLTEMGNPGNGAFQMQFKLFDAVSGGAQVGSTIGNVPLTVSNGVFTVQLDFGGGAFPGADRFLEVSVRRDPGESYTTINPRQQITSSPYSIRTLSAAMADDSQKLGGIDASQYVTSASAGNIFIKNDTATQTANFNISGSGRIGGSLGIGAGNPNSALELRGTGSGAQQRITDTSSGNSLVLQGGAAGNMKVTGFNYNTFTPVPLYLSVDGANTILNSAGGAVGIGTTLPLGGYRADIAGPVRSFGDTTHFVAQTIGGVNSWARYYMRSSAQSWFMGTSQTYNGNQLYVADETFNQTRLTIQPNGGPINLTGNLTHTLPGFGLPKAMLRVQGAGTPYGILRCYNGITGSNSDGCGFSVIREATGRYAVILGFDVRDRFFSVTPYSQGGTLFSAWAGPYVYASVSDTVSVHLFRHDGTALDGEFFLIVY